MNYEEAMQEHIVSAYEARQEIRKHSLDFEDFVSEYGEHEEYYSKDVMIWLGY
jgi:hypothetical protein